MSSMLHSFARKKCSKEDKRLSIITQLENRLFIIFWFVFQIDSLNEKEAALHEKQRRTEEVLCCIFWFIVRLIVE